MRGPRPVHNQTRREAVVQELRRAIIAGELESGQPVREVHVAAQMGVSRPTLREAVYELIHEGLLEQEPYRGIVVASIDEKFITDIADVRVALETLAARSVAADPDGRPKEIVVEAWQAYQAAHHSQNVERLHQAHVDIHRSIWFASGNSMLKRIWPAVEASFDVAIGLDESVRDDPERAFQLHQQLVDTILTGAVDAIEAELERHARQSADELIRIIADRARSETSASA